MARINAQRMGFGLEPRILEYMAVLGYRLVGGEYLWIPRVLSSIFWMIGGVFIYLIAEKMFSPGSALFSTVFYLFQPFGITASRSFQPDPMMVMLLITSIYLVWRYYEEPSKLKILYAAIISALAFLIKPYSVFLIYGAFFAITIAKRGLRKIPVSLDVLIFIIISLVPAGTYYLYGLYADIGFLQEHSQASFMPQLLHKFYFWKGWLALIFYTVGLLPLLAAVAGLFMFRNETARFLLYGLWIGYFVFGLFFTYHIHTHEYYHLPFIPVIALSMGPMGVSVINQLYDNRLFKKRIFLIFALTIVIVVAGASAVRGVYLSGNKKQIKTLGYVLGINPEFYSFLAKDFTNEVKIAQEIGDIVGHSTKTVFLTSDYGRSLAYHGELSGLPWPTTLSLKERRDRGLPDLPKDELFGEHYLTIRTHGKYIKYTPDFFIITAFDEFEKQKDLKEYLETNFPLLAKSNDYLIFDLTGMSDPDKSM